MSDIRIKIICATCKLKASVSTDMIAAAQQTLGLMLWEHGRNCAGPLTITIKEPVK